jgi:hypothetical protein
MAASARPPTPRDVGYDAEHTRRSRKGVLTMPTLIRNLKINELSFCDAGANPHTRVTIYKQLGNPLLTPLEKKLPGKRPPEPKELSDADKEELRRRADLLKPRVNKFDDAVSEIAARDRPSPYRDDEGTARASRSVRSVSS